ncbi:MAG: ZIP family metal transporter, partial [Candidatus Helarchaeota archaeon]|nr:ZIP family metal transporter [Candidatus Helarchaeota archaeon]
GAGFLATASLGISLAFAIALHHIPEGFAIAAPLMQANYGRKKILLLTLLAGMAAPAACIIVLFLLEYLPNLVLTFFLCFAAGAMIYITSNDLIPESHKHGYEREATIGVLLGLIVMLLLMIGF